ncbi:MAG: acyl-CoA carboxylase subunit beta, partial [Acidimicrobiales bacterium]|nr:acyl-CoA carboxylase subunit beta [Acidimicrobiales bacterium]MYI28391.1 acyl-CoA carboxylase subunit beta [Acidimicrobiales bacterium]
MPVLRSHIDTSADWFAKNCDDMRTQLGELDELQQQAADGGGPRAMARMRSRDKMPVRERIAMVLDRDSP